MRSRILEFLYKQVTEKKIPVIKTGMVEDFEAFIVSILADEQARKSAERMKAVSEGIGLEDEDEQEDSEQSGD